MSQIWYRFDEPAVEMRLRAIATFCFNPDTGLTKYVSKMGHTGFESIVQGMNTFSCPKEDNVITNNLASKQLSWIYPASEASRPNQVDVKTINGHLLVP